jgi:mono/diheme cytochrome c family protein
MNPLRIAALALFGCMSLHAQQATTPAQTPAPAKRPNIPTHFTNLSVLPATISQADLVAVMKQFAITMKVRCSNCHAVADDLSEGDFASDEKPAKVEARKLMKLIHDASVAPPKP